ncbi:hypothetical protein M407DRAFT_216289 [Tulasnella calospora MUT 4182]|uniref:Uncharacterized protein n=1 Tax=Tulasnella calospora MUT 4182 TaxID=1051891 RepID=A0A0C3QBL4_9AGAM|nr:hypothetical protein M407DRAFT_216289 [Tulasnella calospora MUT 4182]
MDEIREQPMGITPSGTAQRSLESKIKAREDQRSDLVSTTNFRHLNSVPLVHQLPTELLIYIFQSGLDSLPNPDYYRHVSTLSEVCARWFFVVQNSPQIWTRISADVKEEGFKKVLQRSSGHLIDINCEVSPIGLGQNPEEYLEIFLLNLGAIIGRWRALNLQCLGDALEGSIREVLRLPAFNLERLVLDDDIMELDISDVELFGGDSPNLKDVRVVGMDCGWSQAAFKGLEKLHLSWVTFDSLEPILDILRDCPQLRNLEICECEIKSDIPAATQPVFLPNLQILHLKIDDPTSATEQLLNLISAPLHCALYTTILDTDDEEVSLRTAFEKWLFGRQPQRVLEALDGLELHLGGSQVAGCFMEFALSSGSSVIKGGAGARDAREATRSIGCVQNMLQRSRVLEIFTTLKVSCWGLWDFQNPEFTSQFSRLPPITHLELVGLSSLSESALIADIFGGSSPHTVSPFATVRHLSFREIHIDFVSDIIRAALGSPETETGSTSKGHIYRLNRLELHVEEEDFTRAEEVVKTLRENLRIGKVDLYVVL